jgi:hypothetical protein
VKPFDKELYATNDPAKEYVIEWLTSKGYKAQVNPDQYGIDLLVSKGNRHSGIEVEVKHNWKGYMFPYRTVHVSLRKIKFFTNDDTHLLMLNDDWSCALSFTASQIRQAPIVVKNTIYTKSESFMELPTAQATHYQLR